MTTVKIITLLNLILGAAKMSKIFNIIENGKIPVQEYGFFEIVASIVETEYPKCFITKNQGKFYAFLEIENSDELFGWNVSCVSLKDINLVNSGKNDVQSLFLNKDSYQLFFTDGLSSGLLNKVDSFSGKYEVKGSMLCPNFCDMDSLFDYHRFAELSAKEQSSKVSIVLQDDRGCPAGLLIRIINYMKSLCKNLENPLDIDKSLLTAQDNSTVITFSFDDSCGDLFKSNDIQSTISKGLNDLGNFLSCTEPASLLKQEDKKNGVALKKYEKLVNEFVKTNDAQPKIVLSTPERSMPVSFVLTKNKAKEKQELVKKAINIMKENTIKKTEVLDREGILTGIVTLNGNYFSFKTVSKEVISGNVDFGIVGVKTFDVGGTKYKAKLEKTSVLSRSRTMISESYRLISLSPIEKENIYKDIPLKI